MTILLSAILLLAQLSLGFIVIRGTGKLRRLTDSSPAREPASITVVVAARDEADTITPAMQSLLQQRGLKDRLRIVAVNDRSSDSTGALLEAMAAEDERLTVRHIDVLPAGWIGKTHALWQGAQAGKDDDWLLLTDADVVMAPDAIARALGEADRQQLDHLTIAPDLNTDSPLLRVLLIQFGLSFLGYFRPWRLPTDPTCFTGIGAFNLVRAQLYHNVGGHRSIALTPLDDMLLARVLRGAGARSRLLFADGLVRLTWYDSVTQMIQGFGKNGFAAFDFRVHRLVLLTACVALLQLGPWFGMALMSGGSRWLSATAALASIAIHAWFARRSHWPLSTALLAPLGTVLSLWMWWRASLSTLWSGGIDWRGTSYSLSELRKSHDRIRLNR